VWQVVGRGGLCGAVREELEPGGRRGAVGGWPARKKAEQQQCRDSSKLAETPAARQQKVCALDAPTVPRPISVQRFVN
jgi:hypothetical protein